VSLRIHVAISINAMDERPLVDERRTHTVVHPVFEYADQREGMLIELGMVGGEIQNVTEEVLRNALAGMGELRARIERQDES
jgi:hypothetical protein